MAAKYILAALAAIFLTMALLTTSGAKSRTWLMIGVIFAIVSAWLFYQR